MSTEPTPEEMAKALIYTTHVTHEIEQAVIEEIEKIEGRVPTNQEIHQYGVKRINKDMSMEFFWRGLLILTMKPGQVDEETGKRGTLLIIRKQPERVAE